MKNKFKEAEYNGLRINMNYDIEYWARHWKISKSTISEATTNPHLQL